MVSREVAFGADSNITSPSLSPDGKSVAYCVYTADGDNTILSSEIWIANRDGSGARRLTSGAIDGNIRWNPNSKQIAFIRAADIWTANSDGPGIQQITKTKDAIEFSPAFSNDGKALFFVRSPIINAAAAVPKAEPLYINGTGGLVSYSLVSKQEKERFKSLDDVKAVIANRADANEIFLLYQAYDPKAGNGVGGLTDTVVAAAKLDGSGRRILKTQKPKATAELSGLYAVSSGAVIETQEESADYGQIWRYAIPQKNGVTTVKSEEIPLVLSDISLDGNTLIGVGATTKTVDGKFKIERSIKFYDVAAKETSFLDRDLLLGMAVAIKTTAGPSAEAKAHFEAGNKNLDEGATGVAIDELSKAIQIYPDYAEAYSALAKCYARRYEWDDAIANITQVIRLTPNDSEAYFARADYNAIAANYPAADADYAAAIRLAPKNPKLYRARAAYLRKTGDKELAEKDEQKAKELEP